MQTRPQVYSPLQNTALWLTAWLYNVESTDDTVQALTDLGGTHRYRGCELAQLLVDGISALQLHAPYQGSLEAEHTLIAQARAAVGEGTEIWRAISMTQPEGPTIAKALAEPGSDADKLVLDAHGGGSGHTFDWDTIPAEVKAMSLLAGGIGPANVTEALAVGCAGVDLNSAVEYPATAGTWAGYKDAAAVRQTFDTIANFHYPTTSTTSITDEDPS